MILVGLPIESAHTTSY